MENSRSEVKRLKLGFQYQNKNGLDGFSGIIRSFKGSLLVYDIDRKTLTILWFFSMCLRLCTELHLAILRFVHVTLARVLSIKNVCLQLCGPLNVRINVLMSKTSTVILLIICVFILFILCECLGQSQNLNKRAVVCLHRSKIVHLYHSLIPVSWQEKKMNASIEDYNNGLGFSDEN